MPVAKFMRNNYRQSVKIIASHTALLAKRDETNEDYEAWLKDERAYFKALRNESPAIKLRTKYQGVRVDLEDAR